jgi:hypothetical protein
VYRALFQLSYRQLEMDGMDMDRVVLISNSKGPKAMTTDYGLNKEWNGAFALLVDKASTRYLGHLGVFRRDQQNGVESCWMEMALSQRDVMA